MAVGRWTIGELVGRIHDRERSDGYFYILPLPDSYVLDTLLAYGYQKWGESLNDNEILTRLIGEVASFCNKPLEEVKSLPVSQFSSLFRKWRAGQGEGSGGAGPGNGLPPPVAAAAGEPKAVESPPPDDPAARKRLLVEALKALWNALTAGPEKRIDGFVRDSRDPAGGHFDLQKLPKIVEAAKAADRASQAFRNVENDLPSDQASAIRSFLWMWEDADRIQSLPAGPATLRELNQFIADVGGAKVAPPVAAAPGEPHGIPAGSGKPDTLPEPEPAESAKPVDETLGRLLYLVGDGDAIKILSVAREQDRSANDRMYAIIKMDQRYEGFDSTKWGELLAVTPDAVRQTDFWKTRKQRRERQ
jgi:hypothetical protein